MQIEILETHGAASLIQWRDANGIHRATIPTNEITHDADTTDAPYAVLTQGVPFGEAWEVWDLGNVGAERVAMELRERNIWSKADARKNIATVRAALLAAYSADMQTILEKLRADT